MVTAPGRLGQVPDERGRIILGESAHRRVIQIQEGATLGSHQLARERALPAVRGPVMATTGLAASAANSVSEILRSTC
jgi:hypothetical protein